MVSYITSTNNQTSSGNSLTTSFDATSSAKNRILVVFFACRGAVSGNVTFDENAMTQERSQVAGGNFNNSYVYYLVNPPSGTYNIVLNTTKTGYIYLGAALYAGVNQSSPIVYSNSIGSTYGKNFSVSLTASNDNDWGVACGWWTAVEGRQNVSAGTNEVARISYDEFTLLTDTNGGISGTYSMISTTSANDYRNKIGIVLNSDVSSYNPAVGRRKILI